MRSNDFDFKAATIRLLKAIVVWLAVLLLIALLTNCTSTKYVEVEKVRVDTTYITKWQKDSVWLHDSIHVIEKGNTVLIEKWHTKWRDRLRVDTIYQATHDTIPAPYPVTEYVEKDLNWWQRLRLWIGNIGLIAILGVIGYYGVKLWRRFKIF